MNGSEIHVVTGAYGFSGQYIARQLLGERHRVRTLTNSPRRADPFAGAVEVHPYNFDNTRALVDSLRGARVLYNTYWVRFNTRQFTHEQAVDNTMRLFAAAKAAGVSRVVHVSITNPVDNSPLEYFRGKAQLEKALIDSGLSYAILRPAVLFGDEDILINNIAWTLRRLPVFGLFGDGSCRLQPIYVDDLASLAIAEGKATDNTVINAIGPETFTYRELVQTIGREIGVLRPIVSLPPVIAYPFTRVLGWLLHDVIITREEITGLMNDLLYVDAPPTGTTRLSTWIRSHAGTLGVRYANELARRIQK